MKNFLTNSLKRDRLHHAYGIEGHLQDILPSLQEFFEDTLQVPTMANPDFYVVYHKVLTIAHSRELARAASRKPVSGTKKYIVVGFSDTTSEAQNALLKTLEEPTASTHFFVVVPTFSILLPTVRSRIEEIKASASEIDDQLAHEFMKASPAGRMKVIAKIIEEGSQDRAIAFVTGIEQLVRKKERITKISPDGIELLKELQKVRNHMRDRGGSLKMLLEHIAFVVPR